MIGHIVQHDSVITCSIHGDTVGVSVFPFSRRRIIECYVCGTCEVLEAQRDV